MEQVRMAPLDAVSFIVGKTIPYFVDLARRRRSASSWPRWCCSACRCAARGCCCSLALSLFLVGALGLGLLISSVADTQQVAFQIALLASFLPTLMLSGFIFPISSMPRVPAAPSPTSCRRATSSIALRGIVLKGAGIAAFWAELVALAIFAVVMLGARVGAAATAVDVMPCDAVPGFLVWKELLELKQDPRLFGDRRARADPAAR